MDFKVNFQCLIVQIQTLGPGRFKLNNLMNVGGKYIYMDEDYTSKYNVVREKLIKKLTRDVVIVVSLVFLAFIIAAIPALYMIVFKRARVTFLGTELPFFEPDSDIGFLLNLAMQGINCVVAITACIAIEIGATLIHNVVYSMPHLMHVDTRELGEEVRTNGMTLAAKVGLRNIFMKVQDFEKYFRM